MIESAKSLREKDANQISSRIVNNVTLLYLGFSVFAERCSIFALSPLGLAPHFGGLETTIEVVSREFSDV